MAENKKENFLTIEDLEVVYSMRKSTVHAVNHVSLSMKKGDVLALVGETGAGKTTIAKSILRILPDPPAQMLHGKITLDGVDITGLSEEEMLKVRGAKIAMIFQDPMTALNPLMTVGEQIEEGLLLHNDYGRAEAHQRAGDLLEMVGIARQRLQEYPFQFSGGMKQRVVIAMALACSPDLLLADEPTTALDVTIQAQVLDLIKDLRDKNNTSMILITHDLGVVANVCDYVAVIYAGEVVEYGNKEQLFLNPSHPYTIGLFNSLPPMDDDSTMTRLKPIPGAMPDPTNLPEGCAFSIRCPFATEECKKGHPGLTDLGDGHLCRCPHPVKREDV